MGDVLRPMDETNPLPVAEDKEQILVRIGAAADALCAAHENTLPNCHRAPAHLQIAALALASHRVLLSEARSRDDLMVANALRVRATVANALGVVAPPDGSDPYEIGGMWLPNKLAFFFTGAMFLPQRRQSIVERMMHNFEVDLGASFEMAAIDPSPSRHMTRCFYATFLEREAASDPTSDARILQAVFQALHGATFCGVPGFTFARAANGHGGCFQFDGLVP